MNVPVWPIHQRLGVERVVASTYQAASGAGALAMAELEQQARWVDAALHFPSARVDQSAVCVQ